MSSKLLKKLFKSTFSTTVNEEKMEKNENNLLETHKMNGKTLNAKKNSTACQKKHLGSEKQGHPFFIYFYNITLTFFYYVFIK